ncbi:hypothetical protein LguiA_027389 [Lonicera macranthoides]
MVESNNKLERDAAEKEKHFLVRNSSSSAPSDSRVSAKSADNDKNKKKKKKKRNRPSDHDEYEEEVIPEKKRRGEIRGKEDGDTTAGNGGFDITKEVRSLRVRKKKEVKSKNLGRTARKKEQVENNVYGNGDESEEKEVKLDKNANDIVKTNSSLTKKKSGLVGKVKAKDEGKSEEQDGGKKEGVRSVRKSKTKATAKIKSSVDSKKVAQKKLGVAPKTNEREDIDDDDDYGARNLRPTRNKSQTKSKVSVRRKYFVTHPSGDDCNMCHQCQRSDKEVVVRCRSCQPKPRQSSQLNTWKRYCRHCIQTWYPLLSEEDIEERCPFCRGNCNCKACLRRTDINKGLKYTGVPEEGVEKIRWLKYMAYVLYPFLKRFDLEQMKEKEIEAKIQEAVHNVHMIFASLVAKIFEKAACWVVITGAQYVNGR